MATTPTYTQGYGNVKNFGPQQQNPFTAAVANAANQGTVANTYATNALAGLAGLAGGGGSGFGISGVSGGYGTSSGSTNPYGTPTVPYPSVSSSPTAGAGSTSSVAPVSYDVPGLEAAENATYARAKDQASNTAASALTALQGQLEGRGMGGGGYEAGQIGKQVAQTANTVGQVSQQQAIQEAQQEQQIAEQQYQGNITQRGQTLQSQQAANALAAQQAEAQYQGNITQRGEDLTANEQAAQRQLQYLQLALNGLKGGGFSPSGLQY